MAFSYHKGNESYAVKGGCIDVRYVVLGPIANNTYLIDDGEGGVIVVDPSAKPQAILDACKGSKISAYFVTHCHWDHVGALAALVDQAPAPVYCGRIDAPLVERGQRAYGMEIAGCPVSNRLEDGESFQVGGIMWKAILTPGHTPGGMCYLATHGTHPGAPVLLSGDTLFCGSIGRTDFEGGSMKSMRSSLRKLGKLSDKTIVLPGHNDVTSIGNERRRVLEAF